MRHTIEILGKLTAVNTDNVEVNGLVVFVKENTVYSDHTNLPIAFADLRADQLVEVKMIKNPDGTLTALSIKIEDASNFTKISGFSGAVNGSSIQLPTGSYEINSSTAVIDNNFNLINANQLASGQPVTIWASADASLNQTALRIQLKVNAPTGINDNLASPADFVLKQNYPNPFNPSTTISFTINADQHVILKVFNAIGQEIRTLINGNLSGGRHNVTFDAQGLSSGLYFYRLESGNLMQVKKMMLLK